MFFRRHGTRQERKNRPRRPLLLVFLVLLLVSGSVLTVYFYQSYRAWQAAVALEQSYQEQLKDLEQGVKSQEEELPLEPQPFVVPTHLESFVEQNPEFVGVISIPALEQTYPVVQGANNEFYLDHDFYRQYSQYGAIYLDYRVDLGDPSTHIILYGHNMLDGQMFGKLTRLARPEVFATNPQVVFDTIYGTFDFQVFSTHIVQHTEVDYLKTRFGQAAYQEFIEKLNSESNPPVLIPATPEQRLMTLVTCHDYNYETQRFLVHAALQQP